MAGVDDMPLVDGPQAASHVADTSGFAEHLRLVHFSLVGACVVALIALTGKSTSTAERAFEQVSQLLWMQKKWDDGDWLAKLVETLREARAKKDGLPARIKPAWLAWSAPGPPPKLLARISAGHRFASGPLGDTDSQSVTRTFSRGILPRKPNNSDDDDDEETSGLSFVTLNDARAIWNHLDRNRFAVFPKSLISAVVINGGGERAEAKITPSVPNEIKREFGGLPFYLKADLLNLIASRAARDNSPQKYAAAIKFLEADAKTECYSLSDKTDLIILIRLNCVADELNGQWLLAQGLSPTPPPGAFEKTFPDLAELSKNLGPLKLNDLRSVFFAEKARSAEKVELFGAKIPEEAVTYWGSFLLLAIGGYFYVVFREMRERLKTDDKVWMVPWIGISRSPPSWTCFILSIMIFPATIAYIGWRGTRTDLTLTTASIWFFVFAASLLITFGIVREWKKILAASSNGILATSPPHPDR